MLKRCSGYDMYKLIDIYRACGWPSEDFRKEECMKKIEEAKEEVFG